MVLPLKNFTVDSSRWKLANNLIVLSIALWGVSIHQYSRSNSSIFESLLIEAFAPIQRSTLSIKERISYLIDHYILIVNTSKNNEELKKELTTLENRIFKMSEVEKENARLKALLDFGAEIPRKKVLAQIVSFDSSSEFKVLRVNKGRNDGLKEMSPVITMTGLVGYVYRLTPNYADILTILDQNNRVDAIVSRTRSHGIVEGTSGFKCQLKHVNRAETVELGDVIITAGLGVIYPKGIKVGVISKIDKESFGVTQDVEITPSVDFHRLEEVVVLIEDKKPKRKSRKSETKI